jgi:hypothetical protein
MPGLAPSLATFVMAAVASADPCGSAGMLPSDIHGLVRLAVRTLGRCGHDPAAYRVELRRAPPARVVFVPVEPSASYPLEVRLDEPCTCRWPRAAALSDMQRRVLDHARRAVAELRDPPWLVDAATEVEIVEIPDALAVHVAAPRGVGTGGASPDVVVLLAKDDLRTLRIAMQRPPAERP